MSEGKMKDERRKSEGNRMGRDWIFRGKRSENETVQITLGIIEYPGK